MGAQDRSFLGGGADEKGERDVSPFPHVPRQSSRPLRGLLDDVEQLCERAARECQRAATLREEAARERERSWNDPSNHGSDQYAKVEGTVDGVPTTGIIRRDGSISGDRALLERIAVIVAMRDSLAGGTLIADDAGSPLVSTLTATRACDRVVAVEIFDSASGNSNRSSAEGSAASATGSTHSTSGEFTLSRGASR